MYFNELRTAVRDDHRTASTIIHGRTNFVHHHKKAETPKVPSPTAQPHSHDAAADDDASSDRTAHQHAKLHALALSIEKFGDGLAHVEPPRGTKNSDKSLVSCNIQLDGQIRLTMHDTKDQSGGQHHQGHDQAQATPALGLEFVSEARGQPLLLAAIAPGSLGSLAVAKQPTLCSGLELRAAIIVNGHLVVGGSSDDSDGGDGSGAEGLDLDVDDSSNSSSSSSSRKGMVPLVKASKIQRRLARGDSVRGLAVTHTGPQEIRRASACCGT